MPSKNKTELLKLNQWQENEYPKMDDFNDDNKKLDDAYKGIVNKLNDKAEKSYVDEKISRPSTIVIANYDSKDSSKKGADIVINRGENASKKINDAIQSLKGIGGEVKLMEGNYNLEYGIAVNVDGVHLTGIPGATVLIQNTNWKRNHYAGNRLHIIDTWRSSNKDSVDVEISNLYVKGAGAIISDSPGFSCWGSTIVTNCTIENSGSHGFGCGDSSIVNNCISKNSGSYGFYCYGSSTVCNCISENSGSEFYMAYGYKGVCAFNVLIGDKLSDNSSRHAVVEYNIIKEV